MSRDSDRAGAARPSDRANRSGYGRRDSPDARRRSGQSWPGRAVYRVAWTLAFALARVFFRLRVEGRANFPAGPFVLAPVHRSFIDTPIAALITPRRMRFMGKETLWGSKPLGALLTLLGGFPVERGTADRTALRAAGDVLALGEPLVMFPEGTRREGDRLRRDDMHDGPAFVAARAGVPIVPVGFGGTVRALPIGSKIPRPARVTAVVGPPIPPPARPGGRVPRRAVSELTDRLFAELSALYAEARSRAGDDPTPPTQPADRGSPE